MTSFVQNSFKSCNYTAILKVKYLRANSFVGLTKAINKTHDFPTTTEFCKLVVVLLTLTETAWSFGVKMRMIFDRRPSNQGPEKKTECEIVYLEQMLHCYSGNKHRNVSKTQLRHRQSL